MKNMTRTKTEVQSLQVDDWIKIAGVLVRVVTCTRNHYGDYVVRVEPADEETNPAHLATLILPPIWTITVFNQDYTD